MNQMGSRGVEDSGSGTDVIPGYLGTVAAGGQKRFHIHRQSVTATSNLLPSLLRGVVAEYMAEEKISDQYISYEQRGNRFCQTGMAAVNVGTIFRYGDGAGITIALGAGGASLWRGSDDLAEGGTLFGIGNQLIQVCIKDRDANIGNTVKIFKKTL